MRGSRVFAATLGVCLLLCGGQLWADEIVIPDGVTQNSQQILSDDDSLRVETNGTIGVTGTHAVIANGANPEIILNEGTIFSASTSEHGGIRLSDSILNSLTNLGVIQGGDHAIARYKHGH